MLVFPIGLFSSSSGGAASTATWNPSDKGAGITLSGGNLIAATTTNSDALVRSTTSKTSGKYYVEIVVGGIPTGFNYPGFGVANATETLTNYIGQTTNSRGWYIQSSGGSWYNNAQGGAGPTTFVANDVVGLAIDLDNGKIYINKNGGSWFGSASGADPAANTNGQTISVTGALFVCGNVRGDGTNTSSVTARFSSSSWTGTAPSGFGQWT